MQRTQVMAACLLAAVATSTLSPRASWAAPQELSCTLNNPGGAQSTQNEPVTVTFDDNAKTLQAQRSGRNYSFADVSISNVAISGDAGTVSLAIDRSSLGLVWQQYGTDKVTTEYGKCRQNSASAAAR
jgi:hypothetical protein